MNIESITVWKEYWDGSITDDLFIINGMVYSQSGYGDCEHEWNFSRLNKAEEKKILKSPRGKVHHFNGGRLVVSENEVVEEEYQQFILRALQSFRWRERENLI